MNTVIQLTLDQLLLSSAIVIALFSALQFLSLHWFKVRLEHSIQHEYAKKLADYQFDQAQRQKAEMLATFFAKWIKYRGKEHEMLEEKELIDYYEELNKLSLQLTLWIRDEKLLDEIMARTQLKIGSGNVWEITGKVRKYILNVKDDAFDSQNITLWPNDQIAKKLFKFDK